ncbi:MaoC family dehydratase [Woodsholea maritima]|uniref:MaoC family dehydratase n=1 Tax=Woodsholea maritima TaxID=240237 RepID=UPI00037CDB24|nr:MaoC family dehydratase [Woodsholea maritima]
MSALKALSAQLNVTHASPWMGIDQARINAFADTTLDHQFIHVDPERAKATPFGGPIAHGFLTLSLLSHFAEKALPPVPEGCIGINYGFDKVRFLNPVTVDSQVRGLFTLSAIEPRGSNQVMLTQTCQVEIQGASKPALIADWLTLMILP